MLVMGMRWAEIGGQLEDYVDAPRTAAASGALAGLRSNCKAVLEF